MSVSFLNKAVNTHLFLLYLKPRETMYMAGLAICQGYSFHILEFESSWVDCISIIVKYCLDHIAVAAAPDLKLNPLTPSLFLVFLIYSEMRLTPSHLQLLVISCAVIHNMS